MTKTTIHWCDTVVSAFFTVSISPVKSIRAVLNRKFQEDTLSDKEEIMNNASKYKYGAGHLLIPILPDFHKRVEINLDMIVGSDPAASWGVHMCTYVQNVQPRRKHVREVVQITFCPVMRR